MPGADRHVASSDALAGAALAQYAAVRGTTAEIRAAVERDETGALEALVARREDEVAAAGRALAAVVQHGSAPSAGVARRLDDEIRCVVEEDALLRTVLAARAQEVPAQLAQLQRARAGLTGYGAASMAPAASSDPAGDASSGAVNRLG